MSAIAGAVFLDGRPMSDAVLGKMADAAMRCGFDGRRCWHAGAAGFIRFAHATTPEARLEVQPFVSASSGAVLCFDGRIDNRAELIARLGWRGARDAPDGVLALALFDLIGDDYVKALAGDFAIAIWQPRSHRLLLSRSAFGWRPLLWTCTGKTFAFATEPKTLVVGLGLARSLNEGAIGEFLAVQFVSQTETFWHGISRVPQGSSLSLTDGAVRQWHWHDGPFDDLSTLSAEDHVARFGALFDQALIATTRSTGPVGAHLSGGLDSSSVFARATELHRMGRIDQPIHAFSARFPDEPQDETMWSSAVEAHLGVAARVMSRRAFDPDAARAWVAESLQLPIRPNVLDTTANAIARLRADGERVLLTGEGGDEWLNGSSAHWPDLVRSGQWRTLLKHVREQDPGVSLARIVNRIARHGIAPLVHDTSHDGLDLTPPSWLRPEWAAKIGLRERWRADGLPLALPSHAQRSRYGPFRLARRHVNIDNVLAFAERDGVELRHPLHDLRLTRFYMGASGAVLRKGGTRKWVLREAMRGTLPEVVRTRPGKVQFVSHIIDAGTTLFRERPPQDLLCVKLGWVDGEELARIQTAFRQWRECGLSDPAPELPLSALWVSLAMDMWLEHAFRI